jgi:hypothetical protein
MAKYSGEYRPGKCLNFGFEHAKGDFIVCLSGHCVPTSNNWLSQLVAPLEDPKVAGVYGRQEPLPFSKDSDKRDLLTIFGLDKKVQVKDSFFHNANSVVRRALWEKLPWDETTTNIEDRIWAKQILELGYHLVYEPTASVYHWHGIHQDGDSKRCFNVVRILESLELMSNQSPNLSTSTDLNIVAIIPFRGPITDSHLKTGLQYTIASGLSCSLISRVYVSTDSKETQEFAVAKGAHAPFIRPSSLSQSYVGIEEVLQYSLRQVEAVEGRPVDVVVFLSGMKPFRTPDFLDKIVQEMIDTNVDVLIPAYPEANPCFKKSTDGYEWLDDGFIPRKYKDPIYVSTPGAGMVLSARVVRMGSFTDCRVGIFPIEDEYSRVEICKSSNSAFIDSLFRGFQEVTK